MSARITGIKNITANMKRYGRLYRIKELRAEWKQAAEPLIDVAKSKAPIYNKDHYRYKNGKRIATYSPGNLKRSIDFITIKGRLFVGPKISRRGSGAGRFSGRRVDAFYAHWVEYGAARPNGGITKKTPYMRPAYEATKGIVTGRMAARLKTLHRSFKTNPTA